jgi:hypothetical protein
MTDEKSPPRSYQAVPVKCLNLIVSTGNITSEAIVRFVDYHDVAGLRADSIMCPKYDGGENKCLVTSKQCQYALWTGLF